MHKNLDSKDLYDLCENKGTEHRGPSLHGPVTLSLLPTCRLESFKEVATCQMWNMAHLQVCSGCHFHQDSDRQPPQAFNILSSVITPSTWSQQPQKSDHPYLRQASMTISQQPWPWWSGCVPWEAGGVSYKKLFQQLCGHLCSHHSTNPTRTEPPNVIGS